MSHLISAIGKGLAIAFPMWALFYALLPLTVFALGAVGEWFGFTVGALELGTRSVQATVFAAALVSGLIVSFWDQRVRSVCAREEAERSQMLLVFLMEKYDLTLPKDPDQFHREFESFKTKADQILEVDQLVKRILTRSDRHPQ